MTHSATLYLHAVATAEHPGAGWRVSGDHELTNAAGDRVTIRLKMYGQVVSVARTNGQHGSAFGESVEGAWQLADAKADASKVTQ